MRHSVLLLAGILLIALTACNTKKEKESTYDPAQVTIDSLKRALADTQNESNDLAETIRQISDGLRQISEAEGRINVETAQGEAADRTQIADEMAFISRQMKLNRELIANLRSQLRVATQAGAKQKTSYEEMLDNFSRQMDEKQKEIEALKARLEEQDLTIARQNEEIDRLGENVEELNRQNEEKNTTLAEQEKELNTAYYVYGTKKELKAQHVLEKNDVLKSGAAVKDYFTRIDIRVTKTIKLYSKSAKLMTTHPVDSYTLDKDSQGQYTLRISNPQKFWSVSKFLVVVVK